MPLCIVPPAASTTTTLGLNDNSTSSTIRNLFHTFLLRYSNIVFSGTYKTLYSGLMPISSNTFSWIGGMEPEFIQCTRGFKAKHFPNAFPPMLVTLSGMSRLLRDWQL